MVKRTSLLIAFAILALSVSGYIWLRTQPEVRFRLDLETACELAKEMHAKYEQGLNGAELAQEHWHRLQQSTSSLELGALIQELSESKSEADRMNVQNTFLKEKGITDWQCPLPLF